MDQFGRASASRLPKETLIYWDNGKENGSYYNILGLYIGDYIGIMENRMETNEAKHESKDLEVHLWLRDRA